LTRFSRRGYAGARARGTALDSQPYDDAAQSAATRMTTDPKREVAAESRTSAMQYAKPLDVAFARARGDTPNEWRSEADERAYGAL
jgi:hypothetical protein